MVLEVSDLKSTKNGIYLVRGMCVLILWSRIHRRISCHKAFDLRRNVIELHPQLR